MYRIVCAQAIASKDSMIAGYQASSPNQKTSIFVPIASLNFDANAKASDFGFSEASLVASER